MKKLIAICLTLPLLLWGCGSEPSLKDAGTPAPTEAVTEAVAEAVTEAPPAIPDGLTPVETPLFSLAYDEAPGWIPNPNREFVATEQRCEVQLVIPKPDSDGFQALCSILVETADCGFYRNELNRCGFDPEIAAAGGTYETVPIGGYDFYSGASYGSPMYISRSVPAGMNMSIVYYDYSEQDLPKSIIDTVQFTLPDNGKVDPPFFSQGEPMVLEDHTVEVGGLTLTSHQIPFTQPIQAWDIFDQDLLTIDNKAYLLSHQHLLTFDYDGSQLTATGEIPLTDDYSRIDADPQGRLYVSGFMSPLLVLQDGEVVSSTEDVDLLALAPDGSWGLNYFYSGDAIQKVNTADMAQTPFPLPVKGIRVAIDESYLFVSGSSQVEGAPADHSLLVFDHAGKLLHQLRNKDDKSLGCITYACATSNGFLGLDGNMRDVYLWDTNGVFLGETDTEDLFGVNYPWMAAAHSCPDGSLLVTMPQDRPDGSGRELLIYRLTGF